MDQRRVEANRNGLLPCVKHKKKEEDQKVDPSSWRNLSWQQAFMSKVASAVAKTPVQIAVVAVTLAVVAASIYGACFIRISSDPYDYLDDGAVVKTFVRQYNRHFATPGYPSEIIVDAINYTLEDFEKIDKVRMDSTKLIEHTTRTVYARLRRRPCLYPRARPASLT